MLEEGELIDALYQLIENDQLARVVFDEAHTIVTWGNTFRPVYKKVCGKLSNIPVPKLLLSATVSGKLEAELKTIFNALTVLRTSVFRQNLFLEVKGRTHKFYDELQDFIVEHKDESGIIYCVLPKDIATIHTELLKRGVDCVKYHGQLCEDVRVNNHAKWLNSECNVIIANSSFEMGIDKKDVRYIIHARMPNEFRGVLSAMWTCWSRWIAV